LQSTKTKNKKYLTNSKTYDIINELLIERQTSIEKMLKKKNKKVLDKVETMC